MNRTLITCVLVVVPVVVGVYELYVYERGANRALECGGTFALGQSERDVTGRMSSSACRGMTTDTFRDADNTLLIVRTPSVVGAKNWTVRVELRNDAVISVRYRTADSHKERPLLAPRDLVGSR